MGHARSRGQAWSVDLVIGVLIFLLAVGTIYTLLNNQRQQDPTQLRIQSEVIANILTSEANNQLFQVADKNRLNMNQLGQLASRSKTDYEGLKRELGVQNEFCIYLEDDQGNLVYLVDPNTGERYAGVGSGSGEVNLTATDVPCGKTVS